MNILIPGSVSAMQSYIPDYTSFCTGELNAIRKQECFSLQSFLRKGVSLGYVGSILNLKNLKNPEPQTGRYLGGGGWRVRAAKLPPRVRPFQPSNSTLQPRTIRAATPAQLGYFVLFLFSSRMKATQLSKLGPHTHVPSTECFYHRASPYKCFFIPSHPPISTRHNSSEFSPAGTQ